MKRLGIVLAIVLASLATQVSAANHWADVTIPAARSCTGTLGSTSVSMKLQQVDYTLFFEAVVSITNNGTAGGCVIVDMPTPYITARGDFILAGRENQYTGRMLQAYIPNGGASFYILDYANGYPGCSGCVLIFSGVLQVN